MSAKPIYIDAPENNRRRQEQWFRTPGGIMRRLDCTGPGQEASWYIDRDQRTHCYREAAVVKTRRPTWVTLEANGERLLTARRRGR